MAKQIQQHPSVTFLKASPISQVLCQGFAEIYTVKPKFPVHFLAQYLLNYSRRSAGFGEIGQKLDALKEINAQLEQQRFRAKKHEEQRLEKAQERKLRLEQLKQKIKGTEYVLDVVKQDLCQFLHQHYGLNCYFGQVTFRRKKVGLLDFDQNSHLDVEGGKVIRYIAYNNKQMEALEGAYLPADRGVTWELFDQKPPDEEEKDSSGNPLPPKQKTVYVEQVVQNQKVFYFKLPKLGAYLAYPIVLESRKDDGVFDSSLDQLLKYNQVKAQFQKECQRKEAEFRQSLEQKAKAGIDQNQLEDLQNKFNEEKRTWEKPKQPEYSSIKTFYCLCFDTLGHDSAISNDLRAKTKNIAELLTVQLNRRELDMLLHDLQNYMQYLESMQSSVAEVAAKLQEEEDKEIDNNQSFLEGFKENERSYQYEQDGLRLQKLKQILADEKTTEWWGVLQKYHHVKFTGVLQILFYFLGYTREEINFRDTNVLDWRKAKQLVSRALLERLLAYSYKGLKEEQRLPYAKINVLQQKLERFDYAQIEQYNIALAKVHRYLTLLFRARKADILLRKDQFLKRKQKREEIILENERTIEEKAKSLEQYRNKLSPEQLEVFDLDNWESTYFETKPLVEVPDEEQVEVDDDYDFEQPPLAS